MQPTAPLLRSIRRLALTTKQGPHNFYKGNRTGALGRHTKYGGYLIEWRRVRTYVCPDLTGFALTPFVPRTIDSPEKQQGEAKAAEREAKALERKALWKQRQADKAAGKDDSASPKTVESLRTRAAKAYLATWKRDGAGPDGDGVHR